MYCSFIRLGHCFFFFYFLMRCRSNTCMWAGIKSSFECHCWFEFDSSRFNLFRKRCESSFFPCLVELVWTINDTKQWNSGNKANTSREHFHQFSSRVRPRPNLCTLLCCSVMWPPLPPPPNYSTRTFTHLLLNSFFSVRTVSYRPSSFPDDLWPKSEACGP